MAELSPMELPEPELRPEFIEKMKQRQLEPTVKAEEFKKRLEQII